jgi:hypothetical protein
MPKIYKHDLEIYHVYRMIFNTPDMEGRLEIGTLIGWNPNGYLFFNTGRVKAGKGVKFESIGVNKEYTSRKDKDEEWYEPTK